jgi:hypothetical protein
VQINFKRKKPERRVLPKTYKIYNEVSVERKPEKFSKFPSAKINTVHSNSKFRVSATEAFRKTTFTEVSSSKISPETSGFRTKTSGFRTETSSFRTETSGFSNRNFGFFKPKLWVFQLKLRVFENQSFVFLNQSCSFCKDFFLSYRVECPKSARS